MVAAATSERVVASERSLKLRIMTVAFPEILPLYSKSSVCSSASRAVLFLSLDVCVQGRLLRSWSVWDGIPTLPIMGDLRVFGPQLPHLSVGDNKSIERVVVGLRPAH